MQYATVKVKYKNRYVYVSYDNEQSTIYKENITYSKNGFYGADCFFDYDDIHLENPIDTHDILIKWNFLMDIASTFKMYFEGNAERYTKLYHRLFCCSTAIHKTETDKFPLSYIVLLKKVFAKKHKLLNRLFEYAKNADWRLLAFDTESLQTKKLALKTFEAIGANDHEHCSFCWRKITHFNISDSDTEGYCFHENEQTMWVCKNCFHDFKNRFQWKVE